jgi:hypothetical protein
MSDTSFALDDADKATRWLRHLFTEKSVVDVLEKNGRWVGSYCGPPGGLKMVPTFTRSWLGSYDTA